jgi:hypothetical protein
LRSSPGQNHSRRGILDPRGARGIRASWALTSTSPLGAARPKEVAPTRSSPEEEPGAHAFPSGVNLGRP